MNEQLYIYMSSYHCYTFYATEAEGERIVAELNRRRNADQLSDLDFKRLPVKPTTYYLFFEVPSDEQA